MTSILAEGPPPTDAALQAKLKLCEGMALRNMQAYRKIAAGQDRGVKGAPTGLNT